MANNIAKIRAEREITQVALAHEAGISQPYLHDLENGRRGAKPETWERLAAALGVTVDTLKGGGTDGQETA